jgi:hypothetical protein
MAAVAHLHKESFGPICASLDHPLYAKGEERVALVEPRGE